MDQVMNRVAFTQEFSALKDADFVIEAANENFDLKQKIFTAVAENTPDHAILGTNTSSISISKIAGVVPDRAH